MGRNTYKTAQGVQIDMDHLRLLNESVVSVGNMGINARGDQVNPDGSVKTPRNEVMKNTYRTNAVVAGVGVLPSATNKPKIAIEAATKENPVVPKKTVVPAYQETNQEVPQTLAQETTPQVLRGSLASAIVGPEPTTIGGSEDLLSTSTNTRTIKRI